MKFFRSPINTVLSLFMAFFSASALAAPTDYSSLTTAVDFSTVITAILAIMAALAGLYIAIKGGKLILNALKSH